MLQFDPDIILLWAGPHITGTSAFSKVVNMSIHAADFTDQPNQYVIDLFPLYLRTDAHPGAFRSGMRESSVCYSDLATGPYKTKHAEAN